MSRKTIITGTIILTFANLITKCMGFFNRVYLSNIVGAEGIGLYQLILPVYGLAWSITSAGFSTTISILTAQEKARRKTDTIFSIVKQSIALSLIISMVVCFFLFFFSDSISAFVLKDPRTALPLKILAFAIPFMAAGSCLRGFFLGIQEAAVPAVSQVIEQSARILTIYFLAGSFLPYGLTVVCCSAVLGILLGEFLSCTFSLWNYHRYIRKKSFLHVSEKSILTSVSMILRMAVPLSASRISASLLGAAEHLLIPRQLQIHGQDTAQALATFGELTGMAMPLIMLPSACLTAASVSLVPEISQAKAGKQYTHINSAVSSTFLFTSVIGFGAAAVFAVFPKEICSIIYNRPALGQVLFPLSFLCPLVYAQTMLHGLLNGLNEQFFLFRNNILSSLISILTIWLFMPKFGIAAFLCGWCISLLFSVSSALYLLYKRTGVFPSLFDCFLKPMLAGAAAGLLVKYIIRISEPSKLLFLCSMSGMGLLYLIFLFLLGCLSSYTMPLFFRKK